MSEFKTGQRFGKWTLVERIGKGGNGQVWRVHDSSGAQAAMKILLPRHYTDKKRYARFRDEIAGFSACQNIEGVLPLIDYFAAPNVEQPDVRDPPRLVMPLATLLQEALGRDHSLEDVVHACASFAGTLTSMHAHGYSHRDIKPDNLFRCGSSWCVGDFGLTAFDGKEAKTSQGERLGPLFYMADEMLSEAASADGRKADVYSLAKTLWKLATGQTYPLQGTIMASESSMRLSTYCSHRRAFKLDAVLEMATKHDPHERLAMSEFHQELSQWLAPPASTSSEPLSLGHLSSRMDAIQGSFRREQEDMRCNNIDVVGKVGAFLGRFDITLDRMKGSLQELGIDGRRNPTQQGRHHIWLAEFGQEEAGDAYFWQNDITAVIRRPPTQLGVAFMCGVCIRVDSVKSDHGIRYILDGPVRVAAAISLNQTGDLLRQARYAGSHREFILAGSKEDHVVQDFIKLLEEGFQRSVEAAIRLVEEATVSVSNENQNVAGPTMAKTSSFDLSVG